MRGEPPRAQIEPEVTLPLPALIPDDYVPDVHQRLVFYKRFCQASHAGRAARTCAPSWWTASARRPTRWTTSPS